MPEIKFGINQVNKTTPAIVGRLRNGLVFFSGGVVAFLPTIAEALNTTTDKLSAWVGLSMLGLNAVAIMFGVDIQGASVPASKVTEVETN